MEVDKRLEIEGRYDLISTTTEFFLFLLITVGTHICKIKSSGNKEGTDIRHRIKMSKTIRDLMQIILNGNSELKKKCLF